MIKYQEALDGSLLKPEASALKEVRQLSAELYCQLQGHKLWIIS
jgi:hypothetical protein